MNLSVVTTTFNSAAHIEAFYKRMSEQAESYSSEYEFIVVDDGSSDETVQILQQLSATDNRLKLVELSRNFGHHKAIMVGLSESVGKTVFLIDSDLEEDPAWLQKFAKLRPKETGAVIGIQKARNGGVLRKAGGRLFYKMLKMLSNERIPTNTTVARLMDRQFVDSLLQFNERELFFAGLCELTGYAQVYIEVDKTFKGTSTYSFVKKIGQAVNAITSFTNAPLYLIFLLGTAMFCASVVYISWIVYQKLFLSLQIGYASIIASIWGVGGLLLMCIGVLGIYMAKIFQEVKHRPTIIKRKKETSNQ